MDEGVLMFLQIMLGITICCIGIIFYKYRNIRTEFKNYSKKKQYIAVISFSVLIIWLLFIIWVYLGFKQAIEIKKIRFEQLYNDGCNDINTQHYDLALDKFRRAESNAVNDNAMEESKKMVYKAAYLAGKFDLQEHHYKEAAQRFYEFAYKNSSSNQIKFPDNLDDEYKDVKSLYYYACAYNTSDPKLADYYLKNIPGDYNGEFANEINSFRESINSNLAYNEQKKQKERASKIYVGDPESKVIQVFGKPEQKNRTAVGNTVHEQWVYGNGHYIYIENGLVTGWQDTK